MLTTGLRCGEARLPPAPLTGAAWLSATIAIALADWRQCIQRRGWHGGHHGSCAERGRFRPAAVLLLRRCHAGPGAG